MIKYCSIVSLLACKLAARATSALQLRLALERNSWFMFQNLIYSFRFASRFCRTDLIGWAQNMSNPTPNWWVKLEMIYFLFLFVFVTLNWPEQNGNCRMGRSCVVVLWCVTYAQQLWNELCNSFMAFGSLVAFFFPVQLRFGKMKTPIFSCIKTFCRLINSHLSSRFRWSLHSVGHIGLFSSSTQSALLWLLLCMSTAAAIFTCRFERTVLAAAAAILLRSLAHKECMYTSGRPNSN